MESLAKKGKNLQGLQKFVYKIFWRKGSEMKQMKEEREKKCLFVL